MRDGTILSVALFVGAIAIVMHILGTEIPTTRLPEGALLFDVIGS